MSCHEHREELIETARGTADSAAAVRIRVHTAHCLGCAGELRRQQALTAGLRALAEAARADVPSTDLDARVLAMVERPSARNTAAVPRAPRYAVLLRLAAAAVLAVGALSAWWLVSTPPAPVPTSPSSTTTVARAVTPSTPGLAEADLAVAPRREASPATPRAVRATGVRRRVRPPQPVVAEGFVPLPLAEAMPEFERGEIVRVAVPPASLPVYGLEIPPAPDEGPVQIELLVAQDGHPRAVRLALDAARSSKRRE